MPALDLPVRLRLWDGSEAGPAGAPVLIARSPRALRRILWRPGELGLARAYISGDLDVEGDLTDGLRRVWAALPAPGAARGRAPRRSSASPTRPARPRPASRGRPRPSSRPHSGHPGTRRPGRRSAPSPG